MSDQSGGHGWWLASDGSWYPPQPDPLTRPNPIQPSDEPPPSTPWWKRRVPLWALVATGLVGILLGAASAGSNDEPEGEAASETTTTEKEATTTAERITTTRPTTTTEAPTATTTEPPTTTAPPQPAEVAAFEGVVDTQTRDFTVGDGWELQWDAPGGLGCVFYVEPGGDSIDSEDQPQGSSFFREGGAYYLDVKCYGADYWNARIVDVP